MGLHSAPKHPSNVLPIHCNEKNKQTKHFAANIMYSIVTVVIILGMVVMVVGVVVVGVPGLVVGVVAVEVVVLGVED